MGFELATLDVVRLRVRLPLGSVIFSHFHLFSQILLSIQTISIGTFQRYNCSSCSTFSSKNRDICPWATEIQYCHEIFLQSCRSLTQHKCEILHYNAHHLKDRTSFYWSTALHKNQNKTCLLLKMLTSSFSTIQALQLIPSSHFF